MAVVTLSASFASGGSIVGPLVAEALGVPFLDRAIPVAVAEALAIPTSDALARDERRPGGFGRALASLARGAAAPETFAAAPSTTIPVATADQPDSVFREQTERVINEVAQTSGGVFLGRGGAIVLRDHPTALHVRLDGPPEARVARATDFEGASESTARKRMAQTDRAREAYVKYFYKVDARDPALYHLVLDSTALPMETCVELVVLAARAREASATG